MVFDNPTSVILPFTDTFAYSVYSIFMLLLCLFIFICVYREQSFSWYTIEEDEYNFMATESSEQSRLDLASAYIEIDQKAEAKLLLKDLLSSKNPITKEKAKQLLKED